MSQISLNPTSVSKVQSSAHLKTNPQVSKLKSELFFFHGTLLCVAIYTLYIHGVHFTLLHLPPHQPTRQSPGWMPSEL